jgi:hypothetical protein
VKVKITHLKAAWPAGANVGDVLELDGVPAWAVGKCVPAADDAELTLFEARGDDGEGQPAAPLSDDDARIAASLAAADAQAAEEASARRRVKK